MKRSFSLALALALALCAGACKSKVDDKAAIRNGVVKHLTAMNNLNVPGMDIIVNDAAINGNSAVAQVEIRAKNTPDSPGMKLSYNLQKEGEEWVVVKSQPATGGMQHPAPGEMPPGGAPGALPPGHPDTSGKTPAGHPDISGILKSAQPSTTAPAQAPPQSQSGTKP